jgi:hypothetical protein
LRGRYTLLSRHVSSVIDVLRGTYPVPLVCGDLAWFDDQIERGTLNGRFLPGIIHFIPLATIHELWVCIDFIRPLVVDCPFRGQGGQRVGRRVCPVDGGEVGGKDTLAGRTVEENHEVVWTETFVGV